MEVWTALRSFYETYHKQQDGGAEVGADYVGCWEAAWDHSGEEPATEPIAKNIIKLTGSKAIGYPLCNCFYPD